MARVKQPPVLELVRERRLAELLPSARGRPRFEASGVAARADAFYVVFDDRKRIARLDRRLSPSGPHAWVGRSRRGTGFEDIAYSDARNCYYLLMETVQQPDGTHESALDEYDLAFRFRARHSIDFAFDAPNKGFEGVTCLARGRREFLLALCEGNRCKSGRKGREPGGGRIQVFELRGGLWQHEATIRLPSSVGFEDYASLAIRGSRLAILSQSSAQLWVGRLRRTDWTVSGRGRIYAFPRSKKGRSLYCNVEGVAWLSADRLLVVSDRSKRGGQPRRCRRKDESIHIFRLPSPRRRH